MSSLYGKFKLAVVIYIDEFIFGIAKLIWKGYVRDKETNWKTLSFVLAYCRWYANYWCTTASRSSKLSMSGEGCNIGGRMLSLTPGNPRHTWGPSSSRMWTSNSGRGPLILAEKIQVPSSGASRSSHWQHSLLYPTNKKSNRHNAIPLSLTACRKCLKHSWILIKCTVDWLFEVPFRPSRCFEELWRRRWEGRFWFLYHVTE